MPKIRFTSSPKIPRDMAEVWTYVAGDEVDVEPDEAERWLSRGVAEMVSEDSVKVIADPVVEVETEVEEVKEPETAPAPVTQLRRFGRLEPVSGSEPVSEEKTE